MGSAFANVTSAADPAGFVAPKPLPSPSDAVSLWWCALACSAGATAAIGGWLSSDERTRMQRFGSETLRTRYLVGRASLRSVLAQTLGLAPRDVAIERGPRGRPQLVDPADIDFNVSHTADAALIGLTRDGRIGVDVERADRAIHSAGLARRILTDRERAALPPNDDDAIRSRILRLWTCKEALAKATGDALSAPFGRIDIEIESALALAGGPAPYFAADFALVAAAVPAGYLGTVALWRPRNVPGEMGS
jgi:4'-phosphopantetheinyl transferase